MQQKRSLSAALHAYCPGALLCHTCGHAHRMHSKIALAGRYQSSSLLSSLSSSSSFRIFYAARALPCYKPTPIACRFCSKQRARKTLGADCAA